MSAAAASIVTSTIPVNLTPANFTPANFTLTNFASNFTPTNLTPEEKRNLLFNVSRSLEIPMKDFDENWWPLISNVWTQWSSYKQENGNFQKDFACRFMKHQKSSTRNQENIPNAKR